MLKFFRGARLFVRSLQAKPVDIILPQELSTPNGSQFQLYEPRGKSWKTVVPVYGMGLLGEHDPRLYKFVQACLEAGTRVIVPNLPGAKRYQIDKNDLAKLIDVLSYISDRRKTFHAFAGPITIVAFSIGGALSLSACADETLAGKIHSMLLFSPLYDVREVWLTLHKQDVSHGNHKILDNALWTQYVIAFRNRDRLNLKEEDKAWIEHALRNFDFGVTDQEKLNFYEKVIAPLKLSQREDLLMEEDAFDIISPRGKIKNVDARVAIIHDATDTVVPPSHGERIMEELRSREQGKSAKYAKLLITPLLAHVTVTGGVNIGEVVKLMDMLGEVFV